MCRLWMFGPFRRAISSRGAGKQKPLLYVVTMTDHNGNGDLFFERIKVWQFKQVIRLVLDKR